MSDESDEFAALFAASVQAKPLREGQTVEGTIVGIGPEVAFVDVGGKGEATVEVEELKDEDGDIEVSVGDRIQAMVVSTSGGVRLSRRLARGAATDRQLEDAFHAGLPVEGRVEKSIKGGYEVRIGRHRAFCPISQIDAARTENPAVHEGKVYTFRITEYKDGGRDLVVSRRALLEAEQRARAAEVRRAIAPGAVMTGHVASVAEYGAFVDLGGGVQGLLHVSEMAWSRVSDPGSMVRPGDEITVTVLRTDESGEKIALGLKQLTADPWLSVSERYHVGDVVPGRVTRVADFGAFVELEPGVEALAHASTFPPTGRRNGWMKEVAPGTAAVVEVLSLDLEKRRIGVALVPEGSSRAASARAQAEILPGSRLRGKVERHEKFGVFVFLAPGRTGLIPTSETGVANEADVPRVFPAGSDVEVIVLEADPAGRRIRLSAKAVEAAREAEEMREYTEREAERPSGSFGSLADKLRGALDRK